MKKYSARNFFATCLLPIFTTLCVGVHAQPATQTAQAASSASANAAAPAKIPAEIPATELLQPNELAQILSSPKEKPLVLQVGSHVLFAQAHIAGSEYVGAGGEDAGLLALRERVKGLDRNQFVVIYCGCCPWDKCPNIRAAYWQLQALGFTHLKALYLADNFGANWADMHYPVAKGR
jgi:thiosulfate/3-mercaptopyruvate sulfurtransferase